MNVIDIIVTALVSAIIGALGFTLVKQVIDAQDTSTFTTSEATIFSFIPIAFGLMIIFVMFRILILGRQQ
jgi:TRAP-type C4-dicarboxylate transport system permease small subunit